MTLLDSQCRGTKAGDKIKKLSDGGGLHLAILPSGSKLWRIAYRVDGAQKTHHLGAYPAVTLGEARELRNAFKTSLRGGDVSTATAPARNTFRSVAEEWYEREAGSWGDQYARDVTSLLERYAYPLLGSRDPKWISSDDVLNVCNDKPKLLRITVSRIFVYAVLKGYCKTNPAADIASILPKPPKVEHMAALPAKDMPAFMTALRAYPGERITAQAIELTILTAVRTDEMRFARWSEFEGNLWRIPKERMKKEREHLVPLSTQAMAVLAQTPRDGDLLFPGMGVNTMLYGVQKTLKFPVTVHGFRSTFATHANDSELWSDQAIELCLAHVDGNKTRRAYNRALRLSERRRLMQWWGDWVTRPASTDLSDLLG